MGRRRVLGLLADHVRIPEIEGRNRILQLSETSGPYDGCVDPDSP